MLYTLEFCFDSNIILKKNLYIQNYLLENFGVSVLTIFEMGYFLLHTLNIMYPIPIRIVLIGYRLIILLNIAYYCFLYIFFLNENFYLKKMEHNLK